MEIKNHIAIFAYRILIMYCKSNLAHGECRGCIFETDWPECILKIKGGKRNE